MQEVIEIKEEKPKEIKPTENEDKGKEKPKVAEKSKEEKPVDKEDKAAKEKKSY